MHKNNGCTGDKALKYILVITLLLITATVYFISRPEPVYEVVNIKKETETVAEPETPAVDPETAKIAERRVMMEAEFEKLKVARRNLESRLNRLKAVMWGTELGREEAAAINEQMKNGYALLKHQKLVGAYSSVEQISDELARVEFINDYLREIEEKQRAQRLQ
jgi:hypothetical protein